MRYRVSPKAQEEVSDIEDFISRENPVRALTYVRELRTKIAKVAESPYLYRERPELRPGLRAARFGNYLIFFRIVDNVVEVVRIRHGATDFGRIFQED